MKTVIKIKRLINKGFADPEAALRLLRYRIRRKTLLDWRFLRNGYAFMPSKMMIELTHLCNLRCQMCDLFGAFKRDEQKKSHIVNVRAQIKKEPLYLNEWMKFIDEICAFKPILGFTGGEPFIAPHLLPLIRYIKKRKMSCYIVTNGTFLESKAEEIIDSGLDSLTVSLDGPASVHDTIRGEEGLFSRVCQGIRQINVLKKHKGRKHPFLRINFTITGDNFRYLNEMVEIAEELEASALNISHLWYWNERMVEQHNCLLQGRFRAEVKNIHGLEGLDVEGLVVQIEAVKKRKSRVPVYFIPEMHPSQVRTYYRDSTRFVVKNRCLDPWLNCHIMPDGDVLLCADLDWVSGNLQEADFKKIWNNERSRQLRRELRRFLVFPACSRCCGLFRHD